MRETIFISLTDAGAGSFNLLHYKKQFLFYLGHETKKKIQPAMLIAYNIDNGDEEKNPHLI